MSFASVGSLGTSNNKTSGQTLTLSPSSAVPVGRLVIVWLGWFGDGNYTDASWRRDINLACADDAGNVYTTLQCGYSRVGEAMFATYVDFALSTSSVITTTARQTDGEPKAMSAWEFSIADGKRWAFWRDNMNAFENESPSLGDAQPNDLSISSLISQEFLVLHGLATKRPSTDSYTRDADYTLITTSGTTGGADESNVSILGGFRIATLTGDTVSTNDDTSGSYDIIQGLVALSEIDYDSDFPTFPNMDDFNRADEDPLSTPPWSNSTTVTPGQGTALLRIDSNECARSASGTFHGAQFFDETVPAGDDGEVFATLAAGGDVGIHCFATGSGQNSTLGGYGAYWHPMTGARPDRLIFGDSGNAAGGSGEIIAWVDQAVGRKWGLQMRENGVIVQLWADIGAGWRWLAAWYVTALSSYSNTGKFGINMANDFGTRVDDFGGGTSIRFGPQIYRREGV